MQLQHFGHFVELEGPASALPEMAKSADPFVRGLSLDPERVNVNGGAVALGHPVGCSGARILTTLLYAMADRGERYGVASLCIGGGEAVAVMVEKL
mgnify:CR=1 FL=1